MIQFGVVSFAWIFILAASNLYSAYSQELGHINKSTIIDFEGGNIYAEILPGEGAHKKSQISTTSETVTSAPVVDANNKDVRKRTSSLVRPTAIKVVDAGYGSEGGSGSGSGGQTTQKGSGKGAEAEKTTRKPVIFAEISSSTTDTSENTPPYITEPTSSSRRILKPRASKEFQCKADGKPTPVFTWYRNGKRIDTGAYTEAYANGTLIFKDYARSDNGWYHCQASNAHGTDVSVRFEVVQAQSPAPASTDVIAGTIDVNKWQKATIPCGKVPPTIPNYTKRWYDGDSTQILLDKRMGIDEEGTLRFAYTELWDARSIYKCGLAYIQSISLYNPKKLIVHDTADAGDSAPNKEYVTSGKKAMIGQTEFIIECFFSGKPVPRITWKNGTNYDITDQNTHYQIFDFGRKLKIKNVKQEDEGKFTCTAENSLATKEATIFVNVTTPPLRDQGLKTYISPDDQDFTLTCKAKAAAGESLDRPIWFRNGQPLNDNDLPDPERYSFSADRTELTIKQLVKSVDTASYQCEVNNSEGSLYMTGSLRVINSIEITSHPPDLIKLPLNGTGTYDLTVRARGDSCCQINVAYFFNGSQLSESVLYRPPFRKNDSAQTVTFDPSSVSEDALIDWLGVYRCRVSDVHQFKEFEFIITQTETTPQPRVAKGETSGLWWIGIICGVLAILIVVIIIFIVYKSNYPGETYQLEKTELKHHLNPEEDLLNQSFQEI